MELGQAATERLFRERYSELVGLAGLLLGDAGVAEELGEPVDDPPAGATDPGGAGTTTTGSEPGAG